MSAHLSRYGIVGLLLWLVWGMTPVLVAEGPEEELSPRGGLMARTKTHQFEVFFYPTGLRVYPKDVKGVSLDTTQLAGTVTFLVKGQERPWFSRALTPRKSLTGQTKGSLSLAMDFSRVPKSGVSARFEVVGLADRDEERVAFDLPFVLVATPPPPVLAQVVPTTTAATSKPRFVYGQGYYGVGYYPNQGTMSQYGVTPTVGPAVSTSAVPVEKPWASPHWSFDYAEWMDHNL